MDLGDAEILARRLMREHGVQCTFKFDRSERRFGQTSWTRTAGYGYGGTTTTLQHISLSAPLTRLNDETQVRDVILHEIAHALCGAGAGHGYEWKRKARDIGANPERCYEKEMVNAPPPRWIGTCPNGHESHRLRMTDKARRVACSECCRRFNHGRFDARFKYVWRQN